MRGLQAQVVLVAGGGAGIGAAVCERLGAEGACVAVSDINAVAAAAVAERIEAAGGTAVAATFDIADESSVRDLYEKVAGHYGRIDGTHVNVAELRPEYIGRDIDAANLPDDVFDRTMRVNVLGHVYCTRYAIRWPIARAAAPSCTPAPGQPTWATPSTRPTRHPMQGCRR